jgi:hypothetical protein
MWNSKGTNILVAMTQMSQCLEQDLKAASRELDTPIPSGVEIERLVVRLCSVKERLMRCWRLRDEMSMANLEKRSLPEVMQSFIKELEAEEGRRRRMFEEDEGENLGADHVERVSLEALRSLRETLLEFNTVPPAQLELTQPEC